MNGRIFEAVSPSSTNDSDANAAKGSTIMINWLTSSPGILLPDESGPNGIEHFPPRREHAQGGQGAAINYCVPVDQYLEFTVTTADHLHVGAQFATKPRRHPDGVQAGHSISTVPNGNAGDVIS